jgi:DNA polymerase III epsilon subunit-like protein
MKPRFDTRAAAQWLLENAVIIDTETTGLDCTAKIMEIAIIDGATGAQLQNSLVECYREADEEALALHGITSAMTLEDGISIAYLTDLLNSFKEDGKTLTSFNWVFDFRMIYQTCINGMNSTPLPPHQYAKEGHRDIRPRLPICIMELANRHLHQHLEWDFEHSKFKRLSLARCCEIAGVEFTGAAHRALPDAVAARDLLVAIAEGRV